MNPEKVAVRVCATKGTATEHVSDPRDEATQPPAGKRVQQGDAAAQVDGTRQVGVLAAAIFKKMNIVKL